MGQLTDSNLKRLRELVDEVSKIVNSENPSSYREVLKDINKELKEILNE